MAAGYDGSGGADDEERLIGECGREVVAASWPALRALVVGRLRSRIWRSRLEMAFALVVMAVILRVQGFAFCYQP